LLLHSQGFVKNFGIKSRIPKKDSKGVSVIYNIHYNNGSLLKKHEGGLTNGGDECAVVDEETEEPWKPTPDEVVSMDMIEKTKKIYRSHRGVNSFEKGIYAMGSGMVQT
jgi:hypothetical protein